jgi:hypothetical protein
MFSPASFRTVSLLSAALARGLMVVGCAAALILAGDPLPF